MPERNNWSTFIPYGIHHLVNWKGLTALSNGSHALLCQVIFWITYFLTELFKKILWGIPQVGFFDRTKAVCYNPYFLLLNNEVRKSKIYCLLSAFWMSCFPLRVKWNKIGFLFVIALFSIIKCLFCFCHSVTIAEVTDEQMNFVCPASLQNRLSISCLSSCLSLYVHIQLLMP